MNIDNCPVSVPLFASIVSILVVLLVLLTISLIVFLGKMKMHRKIASMLKYCNVCISCYIVDRIRDRGEVQN